MSGRYERMPSGNRSARNRDEQEREHAAGPNRPGAVDELGHSRHLQIRTNDDDADSQERDGANLEKRRQIIARCQQQPYWEHGGDEAISDDDERERLAFEIEVRGERRGLGSGASVGQRGEERDATNKR